MAPSLSVFRSGRACVSLALLAAASLAVGCKAKPPAASDAELTSSLNRELSQDSSIAGQPVMGSVQGGVATLNGNVSNDAQKVIAGRDAAGIAGISSVNNNLQVIPPSSISATTTTPAAPAPVQVPSIPTPASRLRNAPKQQTAAPIVREQPAPVPQPDVPPVAARPQPVVPVTPAPPPPPAFREVTVPAGTTLSVRMTQTLDSASSQQGDSFSGVLASEVLENGLVALPAGTPVAGHVDAVQEAAHFKGNSLLTVSLSSIRPRGGSQPVSSDRYSVAGKGRGKNTAVKAGGGAAVGAILGGIFGGGRGAAIGAAAGGGAGAGANAITRGEQVQIPSESIVRFQTSSPITVRVRTDAGAHGGDNPGLQPRSPGSN